MPERFMFSYNDTDYEVIGSYGKDEKFIVTKRLPNATHMAGAPSTATGLRVEALVSEVGTQAELLAELNIKFPALTDFKAF